MSEDKDPAPATEREACEDEADSVVTGPLKWQCDKGHRYTSPSIPCPVCNPPAPVEGALTAESIKQTLDTAEQILAEDRDPKRWYKMEIPRVIALCRMALSTLDRPESGRKS